MPLKMKQYARICRLLSLVALTTALSSSCDKASEAKPDKPTPQATETVPPTPNNEADRSAKTRPPTVVSKPPTNPAPLSTDMSPKEMYIAYCGACHSVDLVESQRLSRDDWAWVMQDMVDDYGGGWIKPDEQKIIIDYLAENFGPK